MVYSKKKRLLENLQSLHLNRHNKTLLKQWLATQLFVIYFNWRTGNNFYYLNFFIKLFRHDGNVLLDANGDIIHIDFGFLLSHTVPFERAPFKLTPEFVEVMGGYNSSCYKQVFILFLVCFFIFVLNYFKYRQLCVKAFLAARKHHKRVLSLIEITMEG